MTTLSAPIGTTPSNRRQAPALLVSLLSPFRKTLAPLALVVLVENAARLSVPQLVQRAIDRGIPPIMDGGSARTLTLIVGTLCAVVLVQAASRLFYLKRCGQVRLAVLLDLRRRVFRHFQRLDIAFHERYTTGRAVSRLTNDVEFVEDMLAKGFDSIITAGLLPVGTAILLVVLDWRLGLACLTMFPIVVLLTWWFRSESAKTYRQVRESTAAVIAQFVETMTGIKAVQVYRREARNQEVFEDVAEQYREINEKTVKLVAVYTPGVKLLGNLTIAMILFYGGYRVLHGEMTIGTLAAVLLCVHMFFEPISDITDFFNTFQSASSALQKLAGVLAERPRVEDPQVPFPGLEASVEGAVAFDDVYFGYTPDRPVLAGLSLAIEPGQTVALAGASGVGKTTLASLIARFYDPTSGSVTLDGVDLRDFAQADLRRHVVMITQDNFMFSGTVADNIRFGRPDATDVQIEDAAATVGADRFIAALPDGYDTDILSRGVRLSAGLRQLIALARAFLADPAVLIVDDATSSLDTLSERVVQRALGTVLADRTALVIAHRHSTVAIADRVLVLADGRIVENCPPGHLRPATPRTRSPLRRSAGSSTQFIASVN